MQQILNVPVLGENQSTGMMFNFHSKEVRKGPQVFQREPVCKSLNKQVNCIIIITCDDYIIYVDQQIDKMVVLIVDE